MPPRRARAGFTIVELLMAAGIFGTVSLALLSFTSTSVRLIIRNLATNHSHETLRTSGQRMLADLHNAASRFRLVNFNGTTYTDVPVPVATSNQDPISGQCPQRARERRSFPSARGRPLPGRREYCRR